MTTVLSLTGAGAARAQDDGPAQAEEADQGQPSELDQARLEAARALFQSGRVAYDQGSFEEALANFNRAYELTKRPRLLYNIAVTLERLRRDEEALDAYKKFLEQVPEAPDNIKRDVKYRVSVLEASVARERARQEKLAEERERIAEQERRLREQEQREKEAAAREAAEEEPKGLSPVYFYIAAGLTAAAAGVTVWAGVSTLNKNDAYESFVTNASPSDANFRQGQALLAEAQDRERLTNIMIGVTAGLAVGTAALALFGTKWKGASEEKEAEAPQTVAAPYGGPGQMGLVVRHAF